MRKIFFLLFCFVMTFTLMGCSNESKSEDSKDHTSTGAIVTNSNQKVDGGIFELSIPGAWEFTARPGQSIGFSSNDLQMGGVQVQAYDAEQPLSSMMSNHSEVLQQEELKDFSTQVFRVLLKITPPAASAETWEKKELHYFFINGDQALDLYFDAEQVKDTVARDIAKSFLLKSSKAGNKQEEQQIKTDSGRYQGQADNNFIEIKISGLPEEKAAKVFMISDDVREKFNELKLKKNDMVKVQYYENQYGQLVLVELDKI